MEKDDVLEMMSHFNNPMITKIVFEEDDVFTLRPNKNQDKEYKSQDNETNQFHENDRNDQSIEKNAINLKKTCNGESIVEHESESNATPHKFFSNSVVMSHTNKINTNCQNNKNQSIEGTEGNGKYLSESVLKHILNNDKSYTIDGDKSNNNNISGQANEYNSSNNNVTNCSIKRKRQNVDSDPSIIDFGITESSNKSNLLRMLQLVSEHLLHIIKYHRRYTIPWSSHLSIHYLEQINRKKHFVKCYFFKLSYSVTLLLLIPNENNELFVRNFIEGTIKVSRFMKVETSFDEISMHYSEMLAWTKKEKTLVNQSLDRLTQLINNVPEFVENSFLTQSFGAPQGVTTSHQVSTQKPQELNQINTTLDGYRHDLQTSFINPTGQLPSLPNCAQQVSSHIPSIQQVLTFKPNWEQQVPHIQQGRLQQLPTYQLDQNSALSQERLSVVRNSRSISSDSGIASPSFNVRQKTFQAEFQGHINSEFNPQIVKVCSESASKTTKKQKGPAVEKPCHVCFKMTSKTCKGCLVFYCSLDCQKNNYHDHNVLCKRRKKT